MLKVIYPNGQTRTYATATFLNCRDVTWRLYTANPNEDESAVWVASIQPSAGAIVESVPASRVESSLAELTLDKMLTEVSQRVRSFDKPAHSERLKTLKNALRDFDARSGWWRE